MPHSQSGCCNASHCVHVPVIGKEKGVKNNMLSFKDTFSASHSSSTHVLGSNIVI